MTTINRIQSLARQRQRNWAREVPDPQRTFDLTRDLEEAYAALRLERARRRHGDPVLIIKRARVERELERLMESD